MAPGTPFKILNNGSSLRGRQLPDGVPTRAPIHVPLAESGVVVMAIDFRMPPAAQYPAALADINLAVRWLNPQAARLGTRANLVGLLGTSSGGHQAMLSALRPDDARYGAHLLEGTSQTANVAFIAMYWSVLDPSARYRMVQEKGVQRLVDAHHAYWPTVDAMDEGNPQLIVEAGEADDLPPALLLQGTADDNLTPNMADNFAAAYTKAGGPITLHKFEGQPHAFVGRDPSAPAAQHAIQLIVYFVHTKAGMIP
jgi:acetyl esterase